MTASAVEPHGETLHCPDAWEGHRQGLGRAAWAGVAESHGRGGGAGCVCVCVLSPLSSSREASVTASLFLSSPPPGASCSDGGLGAGLTSQCCQTPRGHWSSTNVRCVFSMGVGEADLDSSFRLASRGCPPQSHAASRREVAKPRGSRGVHDFMGTNSH